ncbi:MAG: N-acetyltransferase [Burkholderiaceae bacterium]|nr:N-acetyltransferase [Burkholderiaceae bacterium]
MPANNLLIRPCATADLPAVAAIYADSVRRGTGSFELEPPDLVEMQRRFADQQARNLPWLAAESAGTVLGYAYAAPFRPRPAYRFAVENSVYVAEAGRGRGVGRALLAELIARCEATGARQMVAVIGDSANIESIALHAAQGFVRSGLVANVGWKFGRWLDVVMMQRALGPGHHTPAP